MDGIESALNVAFFRSVIVIYILNAILAARVCVSACVKFQLPLRGQCQQLIGHRHAEEVLFN